MTIDHDSVSNPASEPFPLTATDREVLASNDADFNPHDWEDLQRIIARNRLETLKRRPSDLRRYKTWCAQIKASHGSIPAYVLQKKLHWKPLSCSTAASGPLFDHKSEVIFEDPNDYKILRNDWPYGIAPGITHLVVWLKNKVVVNEAGDLTDEERCRVEEFVRRRFREGIGEKVHGERVLWFKNWGAIQSVRGIDHVHVLVRDVPDEVIDNWAAGLEKETN